MSRLRTLSEENDSHDIVADPKTKSKSKWRPDAVSTEGSPGRGASLASPSANRFKLGLVRTASKMNLVFLRPPSMEMKSFLFMLNRDLHEPEAPLSPTSLQGPLSPAPMSMANGRSRRSAALKFDQDRLEKVLMSYCEHLEMHYDSKDVGVNRILQRALCTPLPPQWSCTSANVWVNEDTGEQCAAVHPIDRWCKRKVRQFLEFRGSSLEIISRAVRAGRAGRELRQLRFAHFLRCEPAALKVQAVVRGHQVRKTLAQRVLTLCAVVLQSTWRGHAVRRARRRALAQGQILMAGYIADMAAGDVQRVVRGWKARRETRAWVRDADAATTVQAAYRQRLARSALELLKTVTAASMTIQRVFRGHSARVSARNWAAAEARRLHREQKRLQALRKRIAASLTISAVYRGHVGRTRHRMVVVHRGIVRIQCGMRCWHARQRLTLEAKREYEEILAQEREEERLKTERAKQRHIEKMGMQRRGGPEISPGMLSSAAMGTITTPLSVSGMSDVDALWSMAPNSASNNWADPSNVEGALQEMCIEEQSGFSRQSTSLGNVSPRRLLKAYARSAQAAHRMSMMMATSSPEAAEARAKHRAIQAASHPGAARAKKLCQLAALAEKSGRPQADPDGTPSGAQSPPPASVRAAPAALMDELQRRREMLASLHGYNSERIFKVFAMLHPLPASEQKTILQSSNRPKHHD